MGKYVVSVRKNINHFLLVQLHEASCSACVSPPPISYIGTLISNVMVFGDEAFGKKCDLEGSILMMGRVPS